MLSEKGLNAILKSSYKLGGYDYIPRGSEILLFGSSWALLCPAAELSTKMAMTIVEHAGTIPTEPMHIYKGEDNQLLMGDIAAQRERLLDTETLEVMQPIPIIFKDRWQLYQTESGTVYAFDTALLDILDRKCAEVYANMDDGGMLGVFSSGDETVFIAPGRFSAADSKKLQYIGGMDWMMQQAQGDPVCNMSLFDPDADAPIPMVDGR